jgi:hypothetical protein
LLALLASHVSSNPSSVVTPLRAVFASFRKSHMDEWERFKDMFTREELDMVNSVEIAQSYFA